MKQIFSFLTIALLLLCSTSNASAQAFQKGNANIDVGLGFAGYGTKNTTTTELSYTFNGVAYSQSSVNDTTDGAASTIIPISFEYGVSDKFGLGADLTFSNYFIDEDDKDYVSSVKAVDFGIKVNFHLLSSEKNDLFIGLGLGGSKINWKFKDDVKNVLGLVEASGGGSYFTLGVTDRIFFSETVGIMFCLEYRGYNYPNITYDISDATSSLVLLGLTDVKASQEMEFRMNGVHFGLGLALKF